MGTLHWERLSKAVHGARASGAVSTLESALRNIGVPIEGVKSTLVVMSDAPTVSLRTRTDEDLDVLFRIAADLDTWEERNPWAPAPLTRERFNARLARAADIDTP